MVLDWMIRYTNMRRDTLEAIRHNTLSDPKLRDDLKMDWRVASHKFENITVSDVQSERSKLDKKKEGLKLMSKFSKHLKEEIVADEKRLACLEKITGEGLPNPADQVPEELRARVSLIFLL